MLPFRNEGLRDPASSGSTRVPAEITHWEQLVFSFDMDNEPNGSPRSGSSPKQQRSRSTSTSMNQPESSNTSDIRDAALLARFSATAGMSPTSHLLYDPLTAQGVYPLAEASALHGNTFGRSDGERTQLPPLSSMDFSWDHFPQQQDLYGSIQRTMSNPGTSSFPYGTSSHADSMPGTSLGSPSSRRTSIHNTATSSTGSPDAENQTETERALSAEEKRRRNTAASARFRIKKKQRTTNLERSVSDLSGRAEELEREAADLRRENGWLKEIVMLKGSSRVAGANLASHLASGPGWGSSSRSGEGSHRDQSSNQPSDPASDPSSSEEQDAAASRKKRNDKTKKK